MALARIIYWFFTSTIRKLLQEEYGNAYAKEIMKKSKKVYRDLLRGATDLGRGNPLAYNQWFALTFVAPYLASDKAIEPKLIQEMMRRALLRIRWFFALTDFNTERGKRSNLRLITRYVKWYTPEKERRYPDSFLIDFVGKPHENACYYRITRCPICSYCNKIGAEAIMPLLCDLDHLMFALQQGVLHREHTIAEGGPYCDYYILGDREVQEKGHQKKTELEP